MSTITNLFRRGKKNPVPIAVHSNFEKQMPQYTFDFKSTMLKKIENCIKRLWDINNSYYGFRTIQYMWTYHCMNEDLSTSS